MKTASPWRMPMVWLLVALPLGSVVASAILITLAVRSGGADSLADPVRRTAQIQETDLTPDLQARAMGLSAVLRIDRSFVEVLPVSGSFQRQSPLQLSLRHPTRAAEDLSLQLLPSPGGWRIDRMIATDHDWRIQLSAAEPRWRIQGRLPKNISAAQLAPALGEQ